MPNECNTRREFRTALAGERYTRMLILGEAPARGKNRYVSVRCDCGNEREVQPGSLRNGNIKSCGCLRHERSTTHGKSSTPEYEHWVGMMKRCYNAKTKCYSDYGGRGITVCDSWHGDAGMTAFVADMGPRPSARHSLDRIDNSKGYSPDNCRWATPKQQGRNKRNNRMLSHGGRTQCLSAWAEETGMLSITIFARLKRGWSEERALTTPVRKWPRG